MSRHYKECLHPVSSPQVNHGPPSSAFLDELIDVVTALPDEVFAANALNDIYSHLSVVLGPYPDLLHRRAVMCEALRIMAGFESSWTWTEGVDTSPGAGFGRPMDEWETGAFQVSANSLHADASLPACVTRRAGAADVQTFLDSMKSDHALAVEYCARLLRFRISWNGPINNGWVRGAAWPAAVQEFKTFLGSPGGALLPAAAPSTASIRGIDTSKGQLGQASGIVHLGAKAAGVYLRPDRCSLQLIHEFKTAGLKIWSFYEKGYPDHDGYFTRAQGTGDGQRAVAFAQSIGQPAGSQIYATIDYNPDEHDPAGPTINGRLSDYMRAFQTAVGAAGFDASVYSSGRVCRILIANGLVKTGWLSVSSSFAEHQAFKQHASIVQVSVVDNDWDSDAIANPSVAGLW